MPVQELLETATEKALHWLVVVVELLPPVEREGQLHALPYLLEQG